MLHNPKWDAYTLPAFTAWLESQPADRTYYWASCDHCLAGLYMSEVLGGRSAEMPTHMDLFGRGWPYHEICRTEPHTFGAAAERARKFVATK